MTTFHVGDWVRRIPSERCSSSPVPALNGACVLVEEVRDHYLGFNEQDGGYGWIPDYYDLVDTPHTDADLAMALELAELMPTLGGDCGQNDCASCVAHWLRDCVKQELLSRGAQ